MKIKSLSIAVFVYNIITINAQNLIPSNVEGIKIWYTTGKSSTGNVVWHDKLSPPNGQSESKSLIKDTLMNFNYALNFNGVDDKIDISFRQQDLTKSTFFSVYQSMDTLTEKVVWCYEKTASPQLILTSHRMAELNFDEGQYINFLDTPKDAPQINTYVQFKQKDDFQPENQILHLGSIPKDSHLPVKPFKGIIPELLVYNRVLTAEEQTQIESYLALKYGISMQNFYINSKGETIWDIEKAAEYSHNITGIGRDEAFGLNQKQATSSHHPNLLTIGAEKIALTNAENTTQLMDNSFLIWGENQGDLHINEKSKSTIKPLNKGWLMSRSGEAMNIHTSLKFNTKQIRTMLKESGSFWLAIDRKGNGISDSDKLEYIKADKIDEKGFVFFNNIQWDTDGSGTDVFTFGTDAEIVPNKWQPTEGGSIKNLVLYPNPIQDGDFTLRIELYKKGDVQIAIRDILGRLLSTQILRGSDFYIFNDHLQTAGNYLISITHEKTIETLKVQAY